VNGLSLEALLLVLPAAVRVGGMFLGGPLWRAFRLPSFVRVGLAFLTAMAFGAPATPAVLPVGGWETLWLLAGEFAVGYAIGLVANLIFAAVEYAGELVGVSIGLSVAAVLDPVSQVQTSVLSRAYGLVALGVFLATNAHHVLILAVSRSFDIIPVGTMTVGGAGISALVGLGSGVFEIGLRVAAPVVAVLLLTEVAMGLVVRVVPQMNVFIVGLPLKIGLGIVLVALLLPQLASALELLFTDLDRALLLIIRGM
jgi:flagellar biosynthetic protein FliR